MNWYAHKTAGLCAAMAVASTISELSVANTPLIITALTFGLIGSAVPDIDEPQSKIGRKLKPLSKMIKRTCGHRGIFHTFLPAIILSLLIAFFFNFYSSEEGLTMISSLSFMAGFTSHLILDMLTPAGVMIFFPLSNKKFRFLSLRNKYRDAIAVSLCVSALTLYLSYTSNIFSTISL